MPFGLVPVSMMFHAAAGHAAVSYADKHANLTFNRQFAMNPAVYKTNIMHNRDHKSQNNGSVQDHATALFAIK